MKDDYTTNSHYLIHLLKSWENVLFELGSERVNRGRKSEVKGLKYIKEGLC